MGQSLQIGQDTLPLDKSAKSIIVRRVYDALCLLELLNRSLAIAFPTARCPPAAALPTFRTCSEACASGKLPRLACLAR